MENWYIIHWDCLLWALNPLVYSHFSPAAEAYLILNASPPSCGYSEDNIHIQGESWSVNLEGCEILNHPQHPLEDAVITTP